MALNNRQEIKERLKNKVQLPKKQVQAVMNWLDKNEDKEIDFMLMLEKDVEMPLNSGIVHEEKEDFNRETWACQQINSWIEKQDQLE